jgi:hypothetical protein
MLTGCPFERSVWFRLSLVVRIRVCQITILCAKPAVRLFSSYPAWGKQYFPDSQLTFSLCIWDATLFPWDFLCVGRIN